jgi:hypothetical protein
MFVCLEMVISFKSLAYVILRNYLMKFLKGICVHGILDDITVIINYKWQFHYFDAKRAL